MFENTTRIMAHNIHWYYWFHYYRFRIEKCVEYSYFRVDSDGNRCKVWWHTNFGFLFFFRFSSLFCFVSSLTGESVTPTQTLTCDVFNSICVFENSWFLFKWFGSILFSSPESLSVSSPSTLKGGTITNLPSETI